MFLVFMKGVKKNSKMKIMSSAMKFKKLTDPKENMPKGKTRLRKLVLP